MDGTSFYEEVEQIPPLPVGNIGIIYCTSTQSAMGREMEKLADCEVVDVAHAVQQALTKKGYQADLVDLDPARIDDLRRFDWIFNLAETIYGYPLTDFEVARKLEKFDIKFTGSGSETLRACMDKAATKCILLLNGIATPAFEVFQPGKPIHNFLRFPLFVKPVGEDGSIGINADSIVGNETELISQVEKIHRLYTQAALVEQYIEGRDITASIIGNGGQAVVLPLSETIYQGDASKFLTFKAKWVTESQEYQASKSRCPCILSPHVEALIKEIALRAYHALGCRDYARVDFRLSGDCPFVLEVNPNPCINPEDSGFVRASNADGLSYMEMVAKILTAAVNDRIPAIEPSFLRVSDYLLVK